MYPLLCFSSHMLIPMDTSQSNHLKSYGLAFWVINQDQSVKWLLNYRGGSFLVPNSDAISKECYLRGITYELLSNSKTKRILEHVSSPSVNMEVVVLEKPPE